MKRLERCVYVCTRVKAIMILRKFGVLLSPSALRLRRRRLPVVLAGAAVFLLTTFAGSSSAGVTDYQSPLYLSGPASSFVTGSYQLLTVAGPAAPAMPTFTGVTSGGANTYLWVYAVKNGSGAYTIGATAQAVPPGPLTLNNVPTGVDVQIYRQTITSSQPDGTNAPFYLLVSLPNNSSSTYADALANLSGNPTLPQAGNRVASGVTGYLDFSPGIEPVPGNVINTLPPSLLGSLTTTPNGKGWIVDGTGPVSFPSGPWTFTLRLKYPAGATASFGVAHLVVGMWKVVTSGGAITSSSVVVDPTTAAAEGTSSINNVSTPSVAVSLPQFALASTEHLYVQFWRRQVSSSTAGNSSRLAQLLAYQGTTPANISHPPADADPPLAFSLSAPSASASVKNGVSLGSSPTDFSPGSGISSVAYYYCPGAACAVAAGTSIGSSSAGAPYSVTWNGQPVDGTYTLIARATDNVGFTTDSSTTTLTVDNTPPDTSITSKPSSLSKDPNPSFAFSGTEPGSTFQCSLDGAAFASCSNPQTYSTVADGAHTLQVRAVDTAGNADPSPASYSWTIDATPPDTSIGPSYPASLTIATGATFDFSSSEPGSSFQCKLDVGSFAACTSPKTYSALADGSHTFQVRAIDTATNTDPSPASYTWTIDTTPPVTSIGPTMPAANSSSSSATFDLASNEAGSTFECALDGAAYASCTTPVSYAALADGSHTFDLRATDLAGNVDTSPASYTWAIDSVAPSAPTLTAPADASLTNALSQLRATFNDATLGGDIGTVDFQICSSSAPAGTACAPIVQAATSGSVSSGGTASVTPTALADGTYHWQARGRDAAGNQSSWSATRSFQLDTSAPAVLLDIPADGAWAHNVQLSATFSKPSFAGTGSIEFRICSDSLCLGIVRSGTSGTLVNGGRATWSPSTAPGDGLWYWQARAVDSAGNQSAWSASRSLHVDTVAPGKPPNFNGQIGPDGLTLRWEPPRDNVANYVLYVNGAPWRNLGSTEFEVKMGAFDAADTRTFSVVAVDLAGNVGTISPVLVGVPNLVGLTWSQALGATSARGLGVRRDPLFFAAVPTVVARQDPAVPALAERGSDVLVTMTPAKGAPLAVRVKPARVVCAGGSVLRLRVDLSAAALVRNRLLNTHGRVVKRGVIGMLRAGSNKVRVKLPRGLHRGAYRLMLDALGEGGSAHTFVRVKVGSRICRAR